MSCNKPVGGIAMFGKYPLKLTTFDMSMSELTDLRESGKIYVGTKEQGVSSAHVVAQASLVLGTILGWVGKQFAPDLFTTGIVRVVIASCVVKGSAMEIEPRHC